MKDIKSYVIGFLSCACLFLIMGQTKSDNQIGRYQAVTQEDWLFLVDTATGDLFRKSPQSGRIDTKWKKIEITLQKN